MHKSASTPARPSRPALLIAHPLMRLFLVGVVLLLSYVPWLPFPWRMPLVGLVGLSIVWIETRSAGAMGLSRPSPYQLAAWTVALVMIVVGVISPIFEPLIEALTGVKTDYSAYGALKGNIPAAAQLIAAAWLSAAVGEELVYRAFLMHQLDALIGQMKWGRLAAALVGGAVFGLMHAAQGVSGILLTGIVGVAFSYAYLRSGRNLWALILAHGLVDTWGVATLYLGWY